jgi:hypothetical protein
MSLGVTVMSLAGEVNPHWLTVSQLTGEPVYNWALSATAVCDVLMTNCIFVPFRAKTTVVHRERGSGPGRGPREFGEYSPQAGRRDRSVRGRPGGRTGARTRLLRHRCGHQAKISRFEIRERREQIFKPSNSRTRFREAARKSSNKQIRESRERRRGARGAVARQARRQNGTRTLRRH